MSVAQALAELRAHEKYNQLELYRPDPFQALFHRCPEGTHRAPFDAQGAVAPVRGIIGGNKIGKCVSADTLIEHPDGTATRAGDLYKRGYPFEVMAWNGQRPVKALAITPIKKPAEICYRVKMSDGRWFDCAANHRILTSSGWQFFSEVSTSLPSLRLSSWACSLSTRISGARRWLKKVANSLVRYSAGFHRCGEPLHGAQDNALAAAPSLGGVQPRSGHLSRGDGPDGTDTCSLYGSSSLCRLGVFGQFLARIGLYADRVFSIAFQACWGASRVAARSGPLSCLARVSNAACFRQSESLQASVFCLDGNTIVGYHELPVQAIYDFTVPVYENYITASVVHHNTFPAGRESAMHLTGLYPEGWEGERFAYPVEWLCAGKTNEKTRDICQRELFGDPTDKGALGTGAVPRHLIGAITRKPGVPNAYDNALVKHVSGGWSKCLFQAYKQDKGSFMGIPIDGGWMDEEPPVDVFNQFVRGTIAKLKSCLLLTFTPEEGMIGVALDWLRNLGAGRGLVRAGWRDCPRIWNVPGKVDALRAQFPEYEWKMRENGDPVVGHGRVYSIGEDEITVKRIQIPDYWPRLVGIDFGWQHPFAAVWMALDPDTGKTYVYDTFKKSHCEIPEASSVLKRHGDWIPVIWPHDMAKGIPGDNQAGKTIKGLFEDEGVNMHPDCFENPPDESGKKGTQSVSAGLLAITQRLIQGQERVFEGNTDFFEEFRNYATMDGKITEDFDDLMDAWRYCSQSMRFAITQPVIRPRNSVQGISLWH